MGTPHQLSRKRKLIFLSVYCLILLVLFFVAAEVFVRFRGFRPYTVEKISVKVEPGGRFFTSDPVLGYRQLPGEFKVTLISNYTFKVTHGADGLRITHPPVSTNAVRRPEIWIMGCSYTHGWSLNDEETYPWLLQTTLPQYEVVNFGVNGYGTLHSLLQYREAIKTRGKPAAVVVAYAAFHNERNTFIRSRRKAVAPYNQLGPLMQPYARLHGGGVQYFMAPVEYSEIPLMRQSAFVHFLEQQYDRLEDRFSHGQEVTFGIVKEFGAECRSNNIPLVVAGITRDTTALLYYCRMEYIANVNIAVDLSAPGARNTPYDDHPSARSDREYATKLGDYLTNKVLLNIAK